MRALIVLYEYTVLWRVFLDVGKKCLRGFGQMPVLSAEIL